MRNSGLAGRGSSEQSCASYLLDADGNLASWDDGARVMFGYTVEEASQPQPEIQELWRYDLQVAAQRGHVSSEGWLTKKDGSRLWASSVTAELVDADGEVQGFARVVRDFGEKHELEVQLQKTHLSLDAVVKSKRAGVVKGEMHREPELNEALLEMLGYEDGSGSALSWFEMTPQEFDPLDQRAHEQVLRFGSCTPYEKELTGKDGKQVPVVVSTAMLSLIPFRWISFVQDRSEPEEVTPPHGQPFEEIVGISQNLRKVLEQIQLVAQTDATVLILGETGTGKELVARALHRSSLRNAKPFVTLNCAAIPTGLLESELFRYERGAFTGALGQKMGRFEMAHQGTLFLDEVGDIPLELQPKLLRALQEKTFERLGGTKTIPIDVRLVAATNRNLHEMMQNQLFRADLYYRLRVFPIATPPLRDCPEDIPILIQHFVRKYADKMGRKITTIPAATMEAMVHWPWPGNVRELENFIERSIILSSGTRLRAPVGELGDGPGISKVGTLEEVERDHITGVLNECKGVVSEAARKLGMPRTTLNAMMRRLGVTRRQL